ncbi:TniQ family protein [Pseudokordiimonas caeni]|uniref:TniQ family protein n=1 Tax=Pseudokordiimonas caeni TaxID=2997908 RepID=UPI002811E076|nr:TniQ family protein [Pseudokordiimonas caeni]
MAIRDLYKPLPVHPWPEADERVTSWLSRLGDIYGFTDVKQFLCNPALDLHSMIAGRDLDRGLPRELEFRLGRLVGLPSRMLRGLALFGEGWLAPACRTAACPLCWLEDLMHQRPPHWRRAWASGTAWCCVRHRFPLIDMPAVPASEAACRQLLEPMLFKSAVAAPALTAPVTVLVRLELLLARCMPPGGEAVLLQLLDLVCGSLWRASSDEHHLWRLRLYQFEARGGLSWDMMFGDPEWVDAPESLRRGNRGGAYLRVPSVGHRRQIVYMLLDLLAWRRRRGTRALAPMTADVRRSFEAVAGDARRGAIVDRLSDLAAAVMARDYDHMLPWPVIPAALETDDGSALDDPVPAYRSRPGRRS